MGFSALCCLASLITEPQANRAERSQSSEDFLRGKEKLREGGRRREKPAYAGLLVVPVSLTVPSLSHTLPVAVAHCPNTPVAPNGYFTV
jgi:hypothetical protein